MDKISVPSARLAQIDGNDNGKRRSWHIGCSVIRVFIHGMGGHMGLQAKRRPLLVTGPLGGCPPLVPVGALVWRQSNASRYIRTNDF